MYADPILLGKYPKPPLQVRPWFRALGKVRDEDLKTIHQPLDFYGLNYYYPVKVASGRGDGTAHWNTPDMMAKLPFHLAAFPEYETTGFGWPVAPEHLGILLRELKDRYGAALPPLFITESGASFPEPDHTQGPVHDADRISYLASHLGQALRATAPGGIAHDVDLLGYYVWTLLDNFEWAAGYSQRFGLVHVDFDTLERTPKDSYYWYQSLSKARRADSKSLCGPIVLNQSFLFARLMRLARSISRRKYFLPHNTPATTTTTKTRKISVPISHSSLEATVSGRSPVEAPDRKDNQCQGDHGEHREGIGTKGPHHAERNTHGTPPHERALGEDKSGKH
ncbi:beta-glucosidase [Arthrobacter sp. Hiyo1]|nr:beta-glucosidase [Arthrobacter sp. Hiyo1]